MARSLWLLAILTAMSGSARAGAYESSGQAAHDWRFSLETSYLYGPVDGHLQVPSGGEPGTSSHNRPTFSQIGIDNAWIIDALGTASWRNEELDVGAQFIRLSGNATLDDALISHATSFPAGTRVSSDVQLDWYRVNYRHRFQLFEDGSLTLRPGVGLAVLNFDYSLDASGAGPSTSRSYVKVGPQLAFGAEWRPNDGPFSLELDLLGSPIVTSSLPGIFTESLLARYRLLDTERFQLSASVGVEFEQIRFHDDQAVENRISADFGPMVIVGLRLAF